MQHQLPFTRPPHLTDRRSSERPAGVAREGLLVAVVALAVGAWLVVVQHQAPELDASTARGTLAVLDQLLAAERGSEDR